MATVVSAAGAGSGTGWSNPNNIVSSNNQYASAVISAGGSTSQLRAQSFSFTGIAAGDSIQGLEILLEGKNGGAQGGLSGVVVFYGGAQHSQDFGSGNAQWTGTDANYTVGSSIDTWGGITAAQLIDSTFEVRSIFMDYGETGDSMFIDLVQVTAYYIQGGQTTKVATFPSANLGGSRFTQLKSKGHMERGMF